MTVLFTLAGALPRYLRLLRSQYWDQETLENNTRSRINETLQAAARIRFYAERFGGAGHIQDFRSLPVLRRAEIPQLNQSVRSLYRPATRFCADSSSGSTGMPVELLFDRSHQRGRFAARGRYLSENGWSPIQRNVWLIYLGSYTGSEDQTLIHSRWLLRTRFLTIPADFRELAIELQRLDPVCLYAYPAFLDALLDALERAGCELPSLRWAFTGSEVLDDHVRSRAKRLLGVDIADNYGSTEAFIAWQCPLGKYHLNAEHVFVEIVDENGNPVAPGEMGRVLITTLENHLMPLVRYEIGDYAVAATDRCNCGRTLPTIGRIVGRGMNLFRLNGGRLLSPWLLVAALRDRVEVRQFQIVQPAIDRFVVKFVDDQPMLPTRQELIRADFAKLVGPDAQVAFERVAEIPRTRGGKFMTALSELAPAS
jgi:phenylacetate-coenzyme A ligase PaaK-like adenylate-forming protein